MNIRSLFISILAAFSFGVASLPAQVDSLASAGKNPPIVDYARPRTFEIADISIVGGEGYDPEVLVSLSGLAVGSVVEIPGHAISDAVRRYMRNGFFDNARIVATHHEGSKVWLEVQLTQRPRISSVEIKGVKKSENKALLERLGLREGVQLTPNVVDRTKQLASRYFIEKGYSNVRVDIEEEPDLAERNHVRLTIIVDKQNKVQIDEIDFVGNKSLSDHQLRMAMKNTNEVFSLTRGRFLSSFAKIFASKKFIEKEYKADLANILKRYQEAGFRDAEIVADTVYSLPGSSKRVRIRIQIDEGKKYYIQSLRFVGNTKYPTDFLQAVLGIKAGEVYNQKRLEGRIGGDEDAVSNLYYNNGYIFARIDPVETAVVGDSVALDLRIVEGPQATINKVTIKGNDVLYENVVRRELFTKPGKLFSREDLMHSYMAINQLQQFDPERSTPTPIPNPADGTVDIEYNLEPQRSDKFEASIGWSQSGLIGTVGVRFTNFSMRNLFNPKAYKGIIPQGDGQTLALNASSNGRYYGQVSLQFTDPWFGGKKPSYFSASIFYSRQTALDTRYYNNQLGSIGYNPLYGYGGYGGYGYGGYGGYGQGMLENAYNPSQSLQIIGGTVGLGTRLSWPDNWFSVYASLGYNLYLLNDWVYDTFQGFHDGIANDLSVTLKLSRSSIDNPIYTRRGSDFSISVSATPPYSLLDGKDYSDPRLSTQDRYRFIEYHKWRISGKVFTPLLNPVTYQYTPVLMNRFEVGLIGSYTPFKRSPFGTFYMGGDGMSGYVGSYMNETIPLRGYSNGAIAGDNYNYGYAFMRLSSELRIPILFSGQTNMWGLLFVEAGNAWARLGDVNPFHLKRSAGVGVRLTLPMVGLLGLDWGYGFDRPDGSMNRGGSQIHFVLGQDF